MDIAKIFYVFGTIFAIAAILYFTWEYILNFSPTIKSILLLCISIILFFVGEAMRGGEI